ncbi:winged helix-turn-helix transcriptional regulator [Pseudomonas extremaustralis]|nr:winged helix-turn-helix transcriptional regulator [Pseudomonas extremaustralis]
MPSWLYPQVPLRVEYQFTQIGHALGSSIQALIEWAEIRRDHI